VGWWWVLLRVRGRRGRGAGRAAVVSTLFFRVVGSPSSLPGIVLLGSLPGHGPSSVSETNHGSLRLPGRLAGLVESFVCRPGGAGRGLKSNI